jgi:SAM-dependent methyltransferase
MSQKSIVEIYARLTESYHSHTEVHLASVWKRIFERYDLSGKCSFLDLGCGPGGTLELISQGMKGKNVKFTGVDICDKILDKAKADVAAAVAGNGHAAEFISADCLQYLDRSRDKFDVVIASMLLAYVKPEELFPRIPRVLKENSAFIIISTSSGLLRELETLLWDFALTHPWLFNWHAVATEKTSYVKPLDRLIGMLSGYNKLISFPVNMQIQFADPVQCLNWSEYSGLTTPFFNLIRAGKRDEVVKRLVRFAEKHSAQCFHQPIKHGKPFLFCWPLDCIIAEK